MPARNLGPEASFDRFAGINPTNPPPLKWLPRLKTTIRRGSSAGFARWRLVDGGDWLRLAAATQSISLLVALSLHYCGLTRRDRVNEIDMEPLAITRPFNPAIHLTLLSQIRSFTVVCRFTDPATIPTGELPLRPLRLPSTTAGFLQDQTSHGNTRPSTQSPQEQTAPVLEYWNIRAKGWGNGEMRGSSAAGGHRISSPTYYSERSDDTHDRDRMA
ncbi:hypothetical protein V500_02445 [Pseudogymnoascus sp. VKM F-4518 (FW-2643)]|nr:hypothetical protein V500_02445 [Pseudogymnoascus sp. VKM F-4518 (FW-2643)]